MYYKTTYHAGKTIEVHKSYTKVKSKAPKNGKEKATPEMIEKINQLNAEAKLTRLINANFGEDDIHLMLTYKKSERPNPNEAKKYIKQFITKLRKEYRSIGLELKYIQVTEYESTAIHHHLIINNIDNANVIKIVKRVWMYGHPIFKPLNETGQYKNLAEYLIKETSKTFKDKKEGHKQRYSCSKNLIHPKPKVKKVKANIWVKEPIAPKGYYIDRETLVNGINRWTGREYQKYTMVKINESHIKGEI